MTATTDALPLRMQAALMLERVYPGMEAALLHARETHTEDPDAEAAFVNGAFYGIAAELLRGTMGQEPDPDACYKLYRALSEAFSGAVDHDNNLDAYAESLLAEGGVAS